MADQIGKLDALVDNGVVKGNVEVYCSHRDFSDLHEQLEDEGVDYEVKNGALVLTCGNETFQKFTVAASTNIPRGVFLLLGKS